MIRLEKFHGGDKFAIVLSIILSIIKIVSYNKAFQRFEK